MKNQPVPEISDADVTRVVRRDFPPDAFDAVMAVLGEYGHQEWQHGKHRVRLAVLKLAAGDFEALRREVEVAKCDYRDVLAGAEYPEYMKSVRPGADENDEQVQEVIKRDWVQFQNWLNSDRSTD